MSEELEQVADEPAETAEQRWAREEQWLREKQATLDARRQVDRERQRSEIAAAMARAEASCSTAEARTAERAEAWARDRGTRIAAARAGLRPWLHHAGVPTRYREMAWQRELVPEALREWASTFPAPEGGAIITGTYGTGKTCAAVWLLAAFYMRSIGDDPGHGWRGPVAKFASCGDLYALLAGKLDVTAVRRAQLLVVDDLGIGYEHDWPLSEMDRLIEHRYGEKRPTIVTTNLYPTVELARANGRPEADSFEGRYPRTYSRLREDRGPGIVLMVGRDLRRSDSRAPLRPVK